MKVVTRNNLLGKLSSSKWGTYASTIRTTALALGYTVAEYAAPVWAKSAHAYKLDSEINSACRAITGCLKPTNVEELYLLSGIGPPSIRRGVCAGVEKAKQETNEAHSLHRQIPAERCLKSINCFLHSVKPAKSCEWLRRTNKTPCRTSGNIDESLVRGHNSPWTTWRCLNRLRTGYTCSKEQRKKLQYFDGDTTCECELVTENTAHMLQFTLLARPCTLDDLSKFTDTAKSCVERWKTTV